MARFSFSRLPGLSGAFKAARSAGMGWWWRVPVAACWFTVALCALLVLSDKVTFTWHSSSGIHAWVSANKYPKQQEAFWFFLAVAGIPAVMLAGWTLWVLFAAGTARMTGLTFSAVLKISSACHVPALFAWTGLRRLRADAWKPLPAAAGAGLLLFILAMLFIRFILPRFRRRDDAAGSVGPPRAPETSPAEAPPSAWRGRPACRRALVILRIAWRVTASLVLFAAVPALLYRLTLNVNCNGVIDLFHEGEFLIPMDEVMRGSVPYRDIYLQHGLFSNALIPLLGARIFGPTLAGVREIRAYIEPLGLVAFYFFIVSVCRARYLAAAFLIFLCCGASSWTPSRAAFGLLSMAVLAGVFVSRRGCRCFSARETERDRAPAKWDLAWLCLRDGWPFLLSGFLAMQAFWHSVEVGLYSLASGLVFLTAAGFCRSGIGFRRRILPFALYCAGALAAFAPAGIYLAAHGAFADMVRNVWIQCVYQNDTWGLPFPKFFGVFGPILTGPVRPKWPDWLIAGTIRWYYGAAALALAASFLAFRAMGPGFWRSRNAPALLLVTLAGTCFFRTPLGRSDGWHIYYSVLFALTLAVFLADRLLATAWDRIAAGGIGMARRLLGLPWLASGIAVAACLVWFCDKAFNPVPALKARWSEVNKWPAATRSETEMIPNAGLAAIPPDQAKHIREVSEYVLAHTRPDERVFDFSSQAGLLFFTGRRGATRYFQICYACLPSMQEEVVRDLERLKVPLVIFKSGTYFDRIDGVPAETRHPVIAAYLRSMYEPADTVGRVVFWKRKSPVFPAQ